MREHTPEITKIADYLKFPESELRGFILRGDTKTRSFEFYTASPTRPITKFGYYIQVDENTSPKDVAEQYKQILYFLNNMENAIKINKRSSRIDIGPNDNKKTALYILIENEMIKMQRESLTPKNKLISDEGYERELFKPVLEQLAGDFLSDIEDDDEFQKRSQAMITRMKTWHYTIAKRYKLPTIKKHKTILRLLNS